MRPIDDRGLITRLWPTGTGPNIHVPTPNIQKPEKSMTEAPEVILAQTGTGPNIHVQRPNVQNHSDSAIMALKPILDGGGIKLKVHETGGIRSNSQNRSKAAMETLDPSQNSVGMSKAHFRSS